MKNRKKIEKLLTELFRLIVGSTFLFSGFVKAVDPIGFTYKIQDYLIELNLTIFFSLTIYVAIILILLEFALGLMLLLGVYRKWSSRLIALFMLFFAPFTLWIALTNPVEDCGCFGDALIISNWHTFYKNILLLAGSILLVIRWEMITPLYSKRAKVGVAVFAALFVLFFQFYNLLKLPIIDFRPYKIGSYIPDRMVVVSEADDLSESLFVYSKEGVEKLFSEENYPWDDTTWTFVEMREVVVKEAGKPEIEDLAIKLFYQERVGSEWSIGDDITEALLSDKRYSFLMVSPSLGKISDKQLNRFRKINSYANEKEYPFYLITASSPNLTGDWENQYQSGFSFCHADERELKTMIRSNPGLILIKGGLVINKWDHMSLPSPDSLDKKMKKSEMVQIKESKRANRMKLLMTAFLFFVPLFFLKRYSR